MKKAKKLLSTLLVIGMLTSLVACGSNTTSSEESTTTSTTTSSTTSTSDASTETTSSELSWPDGDIRIICPFPAGGVLDILTRHMTAALSETLGVNVIVNNIEGASGTSGLQEFYDSVDDSDSIFLVSNVPAFSTGPVSGLTELKYDSFAPVAIWSNDAGNVLYATADAPYNNVEEFIAYAEENTVLFTVATGTGTWASCRAMQESGLNVQFVDGGEGNDRIISVVNGSVDCTVASYTTAKDFVENGDLKAIGYLCATANSDSPDMQSFVDFIDGVEMNSGYLMVAKADTDPAVVEAMNAALVEISTNNDTYRESMLAATYNYPEVLSVSESYDLLQYFSEYYFANSHLLQ